MANGALINLSTLCRLLGCSRQTCYAWLHSEQLPSAAKVILGRRYWLRSQVETFLQGNKR